MSDSNLKPPRYYNHTIVVHPLRNLEIPSRWKYLRDDHRPPSESSRYLRKREGGFIFLRTLKDSSHVHVGLYATVDDPQELVIIKKLRGLEYWESVASKKRAMAAEIEISSNTDALARRLLPLDYPWPPFVQLHAFQVHSWGSVGNKYKDYDATLFYKYYNGGTLAGLINKYKDAGRRIPEGFIWHFIAQIGRALAHLHTGEWPSAVYNVMHQDEIGVRPDAKVNRSETVPGWRAICHMDGHADNIWLHYPSDEEKAQDPSLDGFSDALPQLVLGDFGMSFQAHHDRADWLRARELPGLPEPATLKDKADLGVNIKQLVCAGHPAVGWHKLADAEYKGAASLNQEDWHVLQLELGHYGFNLAMCVDRLEPLIRIRECGDWWYGLRDADPGEYERFATNDFVYGTMIAWADAFVANYRASEDQQESVRWTQPRSSAMPHQVRSGTLTKEPGAYFGRTWASVDEALRCEMAETFAKGWRPGSVEVRKARIPQGTVERELETVPYAPHPDEKPEARSKGRTMKIIPRPGEVRVEERPPAATVDELPDYTDVESNASEERVTVRRATARRATRAAAERERSPPSPFEIQRQADRRMREERCRAAGILPIAPEDLILVTARRATAREREETPPISKSI